MNWRIKMYTSGTSKPVQKFTDSLQAPTFAKLSRLIDLLKTFGPELGMPHAKPIGKGLYELRIRGKQEVRVVYIFVMQDSIVLVHGFLKKTNAIPKKELEIARHRARDVKNRLTEL